MLAIDLIHSQASKFVKLIPGKLWHISWVGFSGVNIHCDGCVWQLALNENDDDDDDDKV